MMCVCFLNKLIYRLSSFFPQGENIVNASFPLEGFGLAFTDNFCFNSGHKNVRKGHCHEITCFSENV